MLPSLRHIALGATALLALTGCQKLDDAAFGQRVRAYLLEHPEVIQEAVEKLQEKQQAEAAKSAQANLAKYRKQLEQDPRDFVANPDGGVTVVEFFDYRCGYCKLAAPEVLQLIEENPDVRFVFKEFPIFGGESDLAAQVILSPAAKPKTKEIYARFMAEKALDEAAIDRILREVGVDPAVAKAGGKSDEVQKQLQDVHELAGQLHINGTPAFVVGDTIVSGADMAALRRAIAEARSKTMKTG
ncbi:MAG: DsbA family protein [Phenylobacterium sp.]|uniref:DsbA family protein n=1 Tax=Phenylobacterium sp. TaxID=1871053 RepID=UPI0039187F8C